MININNHIDKIVCFGKNYIEHMTELGDEKVEKPVIFLKPGSVVTKCEKWGDLIDITFEDDHVHYECELILKLKKGGYRLSLMDAIECIGWYSVGLDLTLRDIQSKLKKNGHPWTIGKVFPHSAIIGPWVMVDDYEDLLQAQFTLYVNNELKQQGLALNMLMSIAELIQYASAHFPLCVGDILFTGTPKGVGEIPDDATLKLTLNNLSYTVHTSYK